MKKKKILVMFLCLLSFLVACSSKDEKSENTSEKTHSNKTTVNTTTYTGNTSEKTYSNKTIANTTTYTGNTLKNSYFGYSVTIPDNVQWQFDKNLSDYENPLQPVFGVIKNNEMGIITFQAPNPQIFDTSSLEEYANSQHEEAKAIFSEVKKIKKININGKVFFSVDVSKSGETSITKFICSTKKGIVEAYALYKPEQEVEVKNIIDTVILE